jgi:hypothetical protein
LANKYVSFRDGGKSNEEALTRLFNKISGSNNAGKIGADDYKVKQNTSPNMTILVTLGDFIIPYLDYFFHTWSTVDQSVTITSADPSFGRIDRLVAYIDLAVVSSAVTNNVDAIKFMNVVGTASGSPAAVNDAAVQTAVGAGNPWEELAQITVDAAVTSIVNAKITDLRSQFIIGGGVGGAEFSVHGPLIVINDMTPYWLAPKSGTFTSIVARVKTAPTGASLQGRINKNGVQVTTFTIAAGSSNTSATVNLQFSLGDYFSVDITQIGSTVAGSNLTVALG